MPRVSLKMRFRPSVVAAYLSSVIIFIYFFNVISTKWSDRTSSKTLEGLRSSGDRVQSRCRALHGVDLPVNFTGLARRHNTMLVDHRHKLMYCLVPKVASSNVYRLFLVLGKHVRNTDPATITSEEIGAYRKHLTLLVSMTETDKKHYLQSYTKVMFTRDPFERLVSAYHSKIEIGGDEHSRAVKQDIVDSLKIVSKLPLVDINVTFPDFIRYVLHLKESKLFFDQHWATVEDLCDPCHVHYDYVGEYDDLGNEMNAVLQAVGVDRSIHFPSREATRYEPSELAQERLQKYYRDVPYDHIEKLQDLYSRDVRMFGHEVPTPLRQLYDKYMLPEDP